MLDSLVPPNSKEAEEAVLGAIFFRPECFPVVSSIISSKDFYSPSGQYIFQAMQNLEANDCPIDVVSVSEFLADEGKLDKAGGRTYCMDLAMSAATSENAGYYAKLIKRESIRRQVLKLCQEGSYQVMDNPEPESTLLVLQSGINDLTQENVQEQDKTHAELLDLALADIQTELQTPNGITGLRTGFDSIDRMTKGFKHSNLIILAARPSMGKTAMALNIAQGAARSQKKAVLFFSLEMPPEDIAKREIYGDSETQADFEKMKQTVEQIKAQSPHLHIIDRPTLNLSQLKAAMLKYSQQTKGLGLVVIDYLQLMTSEGKKTQNREQDVSTISRALKNYSRDFKVPIIALSQLSRALEGRQNKRPILSDLRDSGAIEQDADLVMFLYRDDYYDPETKTPGVTELLMAKQRGGSLGTVFLNFRANITRFYEQSNLITRVF